MRPLAALLGSLLSIAFVHRAEAIGKVLELHDKLPDLVGKNPNKSWLVEFYAPWCYHCQQLEPIYNNVAEKIYHKQNDLIVGRVDCTKSGSNCDKYGVESYPTIAHIHRNTIVKYKGDRSESSIVAFADRLEGPDLNFVRDCHQLRIAADKHGLVILSNIVNSSNPVSQQFESLAREYKSDHWFYYHKGTCKDLLHDESLYLIKRHLIRPIKFEEPTGRQATLNDSDNLKEAIVNWINKESFPIYGQISYRNFERLLDAGKLLVVAVLDEYKPARRFARSSHEFYKSFEKLASKQAQHGTELIFGWSSDLELIEYVTMSTVSTPNVILLRSDLSYHLLIDNLSGGEKIDEAKARTKLSDHNIRSAIEAAKNGKLNFLGGNNHLYVVIRFITGNVGKFLKMYRANPLLVSLIFGFPALMIMFVVYTTCFYQGEQDDERDDELSDEENEDEGRRLLLNGHLKQE